MAGVSGAGGGPRGEDAGGVGERGLQAKERGFVRNGVVSRREEEEENEEEKLRERIPFDH